jgi:hypothetical protein
MEKFKYIPIADKMNNLREFLLPRANKIKGFSFSVRFPSYDGDKEIVPVEIMEGLTDATLGDLAAIVVNMTDYNVGADKGGAVSMFEDFDIDYNQNKYLIETRCSGALVKPYSALIFSFKQGNGANTVISFSGDGMDEFTIKDDDNSAQG